MMEFTLALEFTFSSQLVLPFSLSRGKIGGGKHRKLIKIRKEISWRECIYD